MRTVNQLMDLAGRKALVTGGAGHIGLAVGEALVELGAAVSVLDVDDKACQDRVEVLCRIRGESASSVECDLGDEQATRQAVRKSIRNMGSLDILVHLAAYVGTTQVPGWAVPFEEQTVSAWDAAMRVNLTSAFVMVQEARSALQASGHGSVILIGSTYGMVGPDMGLYEGTSMGNPAGYNASKGGILQLTRYLATVLAPEVRVNAISPGGVRRGQPEAFHQRYVTRTPLARMAKEEDFKGAIAYLSSDLSSYVTGHNLVVDGGWTAW
jgi:NAD(P)-dependent dehydrogenase (short-subunit alcohol dehydrogenase family)